MLPNQALVIRDEGGETKISSEDLVVGDVVLLSNGYYLICIIYYSNITY